MVLKWDNTNGTLNYKFHFQKWNEWLKYYWWTLEILLAFKSFNYKPFSAIGYSLIKLILKENSRKINHILDLDKKKILTVSNNQCSYSQNIFAGPTFPACIYFLTFEAWFLHPLVILKFLPYVGACNFWEHKSNGNKGYQKLITKLNESNFQRHEGLTAFQMKKKQQKPF